MTELDDVFVPLADDMLSTYGKTATLRSYPSAGYDPTIGDTTLGTPVDETVKVSPPEAVDTGGIRAVGEHLVVGEISSSYELLAYIAAQDLATNPEVGMHLILDTTSYEITMVSPVYSGEQICLYRLYLRR